MNGEPRPIERLRNVDREAFHRDIVPRGEPVVLEGLVRDWPAVRTSSASPEAAGAYLAGLDSGAESDAVLVPAGLGGRMFYEPDLSDFNFARRTLTVSAVLQQMARYSHFDSPPSVALQCAHVSACLPGFEAANPMPLMDAAVRPRLWLGNAFLTPAHIDELDNLACVVAGHRRFTLFPPDQVRNLYIGPLDFTPAGAPVSMVSLKAPDFERYPRFREALAAARTADLEPGDALFIPAVWWHHVESFDVVNVLINYWWQQAASAQAERVSPTKTMLHALLSMRHLPAAHRKAWAELFSHFVFADADEAAAHLPAERQGPLARLPPERVQALLAGMAPRAKAD
jgi:cupin-like protein